MNRAPLLPVADVQINPALPPFITLAKGKRERERELELGREWGNGIMHGMKEISWKTHVKPSRGCREKVRQDRLLFFSLNMQFDRIFLEISLFLGLSSPLSQLAAWPTHDEVQL
jgi:hypothetical protein